jgi:hypothetical protein
MGCCNSRDAEFILIEEKLELLRKSLKIIEVSSESFEKETKKYISNNYINSNQIDKICSNLKIGKETSDYSFINLLREEGSRNICIQIFVLFGILFGEDSREVKVVSLFKTYDRNNEDKLHPDDLKLMISDIFFISIEKYLKFAIISSDHIQSEMICSYQLRLLRTKNLLTFYFFHFIADGAEVLDSNQFYKVFKRRELNVLIDPRLFRIFACGIFNSVLKNQETKETSQLNEDIDLKYMRKFSKRLTKLSN